jgi:hypothetical protein
MSNCLTKGLVVCELVDAGFVLQNRSEALSKYVFDGPRFYPGVQSLVLHRFTGYLFTIL